MKTMNSSIRALLLAAACSAGSALAQNFTVEIQVVNFASYPVNGTFTNGSATVGGEINAYDSVRMEMMTPSNITFDAFCTEPFENFYNGGSPMLYTGADLSGLQNSDKMALVIGQYLIEEQNNGGWITDPDSGDIEAAAVQWAIWELALETAPEPFSVDQNSGIVYIVPGGEFGNLPSAIDNAVMARASFYLSNINTFTQAADLVYLTNDGNQNIITWNIPEPGTAGLLAFSVLGLLRRRR